MVNLDIKDFPKIKMEDEFRKNIPETMKQFDGYYD
jgi:hypothetical protein